MPAETAQTIEASTPIGTTFDEFFPGLQNRELKETNELERLFVTVERGIWRGRLEAMTRLKVVDKVEDAIKGVDLSPEAFEEEIESYLKDRARNPDNLKRFKDSYNKYYYKSVIPNSGGLEIHMVGRINIDKKEAESKALGFDIYRLTIVSKQVVVGIPGVGFIDLLDYSGATVDMVIDKYPGPISIINTETNEIHIAEINSLEKVCEFLHEKGHSLDRVHIKTPADFIKSKVLKAVGMSRAASKYRITNNEADVSLKIQHSIEDELSLLDPDKNTIEILELQRLGKLKPSEFMAEIEEYTAKSERIASLLALRNVECLAGFFQLPEGFKDKAVENYNNDWATYDRGRMGPGVSEEVREFRRSAEAPRETVLINQINRFLTGVERFFPALEYSGPVNRAALPARIYGNIRGQTSQNEGEGVMCDIDYSINYINPGNTVISNFAIYRPDGVTNIFIFPDRLAVVVNQDGIEMSVRVGETAGLKDDHNFASVMSVLNEVNLALEGKKSRIKFDYTSIENVYRLLDSLYKDSDYIKAFGEVTDVEIASVSGVSKEEVTPLHRLHVYCMFLVQGFQEKHPDLIIPSEDEGLNKNNLSMDHLSMLKYMVRGFLIKEGYKDIPRVALWDNDTTLKYLTIASKVL